MPYFVAEYCTLTICEFIWEQETLHETQKRIGRNDGRVRRKRIRIPGNLQRKADGDIICNYAKGAAEKRSFFYSFFCLHNIPLPYFNTTKRKMQEKKQEMTGSHFLFWKIIPVFPLWFLLRLPVLFCGWEECW